MKKIIAFALAAIMALSFAACAKQSGESGTTTPSDAPKGQAKSALEILEKVWSKYSTDEKFPATGGSEKNIKDVMTSQFRSERWKEPFGKPNGEKTGDFGRFLPFFRPCIFSEFHRSLLPFSMLCPDPDSRKGLFCVFPKAIGSVAGSGLAKAVGGRSIL